MTHSARFQAQALAARLPPLLVAARRIAATVALGVHGRRRAGPGEIFWQFRRAGPGDAPAVIDWRQSARGDHLFVRQREWAAAQTVWLWRDGSASMDWRSAAALPTKAERAELLVLALAALLLRGGERVAPLAGAGSPLGGVTALERLAEALAGDHPPALLPRKGPVVLMGDFLAPLAETEGLVRRIGGRGHLLQVLDPAEESLPYDGRVRFEGMEGEGAVLVGRVEGVRADYVRRMAEHRRGLASCARLAGWSFATHRTDQPPQQALLALYRQLAEAGP
ncbi:hypothetical protein A6A04_00200 [Paramagnetospirillum marisnigri]|uniref:DUF58 domain-containing protein n=1 Tax=Paramagnetospirillum marisnigri TaxID=1285242 RepID=A0A178MTM7_9PROT|nr:DUF58 domain-containing protein [Paramagnetospirillum marisnigri]OAN52167.1 hypothetical protein A6A04_00200 [Paramagnetospirillum marisnigri]